MLSKNILRQYLLIVAFFSASGFLFSQDRIDLGAFGGGVFYMGDINPSKPFYQTQPVGGAFLRFNWGQRYAIRTGVNYGNIMASDADFTGNFHKQRNASFQTPVFDITAQGEFNFLPYLVGKDKSSHSSYIHLGLSYLIIPNSEASRVVAIPFGMGYKVNIKNKWAAGVEFSCRKTFSDQIDGLSGVDYAHETNSPSTTKQSAFYFTNDWLFFGGVFISYVLFDKELKCSAYGR